MQFNDGSQLRLEPSGDTPIAFTDVDHTTTRYTCSQPLLPSHVIFTDTPTGMDTQASYRGRYNTNWPKCRQSLQLSHRIIPKFSIQRPYYVLTGNPVILQCSYFILIEIRILCIYKVNFKIYIL